MNQPWKLEEGLNLIRALQGRVREFGYHIALGGGVLNNGTSDKDLDLYFLPLENDSIAKGNIDGLLDWLAGLWGEPAAIGSSAEDVEPPPQAAPNRLPQMRRVNGQWVIQAAPPPVYVNEDEPMVAPPVEDNAFNWARNLSPKRIESSSYKRKYKFQRGGGDRIDVFIL